MGLRGELDSVEHLPGGAHPGTENRAVGGGLVMRVVRRMRDRLRIDEPAQQE